MGTHPGPPLPDHRSGVRPRSWRDASASCAASVQGQGTEVPQAHTEDRALPRGGCDRLAGSIRAEHHREGERVMGRRAYSDPTGDRAEGNLERWLQEKRARESYRRLGEAITTEPSYGNRRTENAPRSR